MKTTYNIERKTADFSLPKTKTCSGKASQNSPSLRPGLEERLKEVI